MGKVRIFAEVDGKTMEVGTNNIDSWDQVLSSLLYGQIIALSTKENDDVTKVIPAYYEMMLENRLLPEKILTQAVRSTLVFRDSDGNYISSPDDSDKNH